MNTEEIFSEIKKALTEFYQILSFFNQEQINIIPFEGSWTAGQVARHVILSASGLISLLNDEVTDTNRQPDEHVANLKAAFLNFNIKMQSPDFIIPPAIDYKKEELLFTLDELKSKLNQFDAATDMTKTCVAFELPVLGFLTRTEVAHFLLYHTQRHVHQLKNIQSALITNLNQKI